MTKTNSLLATILLATGVSACTASDPGESNTWVAQMGGLSPEVVFDIAETSDGRLCALGTFQNTAKFGDGNQEVSLTAEHIQDIFLSCYEADGRLSTVVQFGTRLGDEPRAIAALPGGDVVITGYFANTFGSGRSASSTASGSPDIFLSRINREGKEVWTHTFGGRLADSGNSLAVTEEGQILLAGSFQDIMMFEAGGKTSKLVSNGNRDAFVLKIDASGEVLWGRAFGGSQRDEAQRVASGKDGQVLVAGTFKDSAKMSGVDSASMTALGAADAFLLALDQGGDLVWSKQVAGKNSERVGGLGSDSQGRIYLVGSFLQMVVMPNGESLQSAGSTDIFVASFNYHGDQLWAGRLGGEQVDDVLDATISGEDTLLLAGYFQGAADFSADASEFMLQSTAEGNSDLFLAELDDKAALRSALRLGGEGVEMAFAVSALADGGIAASGLFNHDLDVGVTRITPIHKRGKTDVFLARLNPKDFDTPAR